MAGPGDTKNTKDTLVGLLTTRGNRTDHSRTEHSRAEHARTMGNTAGSGQPALPGSTAGAPANPDRPGVADTAVTSTIVNRQPPPPAATKTTKTQLSPLASTVMREARRELGAGFEANQTGGNVVVSEGQIVAAVDKVLKRRMETLDDLERANIIVHLQKDLLGWGVLQPLIDNKQVTDIHCYDHQTVVLQRGKVCETTGIHWPSKEAYSTFIDRLLMRLGKSLSTQMHTVDASFPNGVRICAVHDSVCGARGPLLTIRVPRVVDASLESLITYQVAPPLIVNYMASLVRSGLVTMMVSGETGTGKTTLIRCLGTQFGTDESVIAVEDTPEVNFPHPYFRSLVSRTANTEGIGEVTLQEHIMTTLRLTPTRVVLGEMRHPYAAEAFLESAQTGHVGMSTIHARNARETLVRLESLLGRAQKSVSIDIIRQQIALAVDSVIWMVREKGSGKVRVGEIIEVGNFVEGVIQVRPMFSLAETGDRPVWKVNSWSSQFDKVLTKDGIYLGDVPPELTFGGVTGTL
jgi:pilus assembly protein CpaF